MTLRTDGWSHRPKVRKTDLGVDIFGCVVLQLCLANAMWPHRGAIFSSKFHSPRPLLDFGEDWGNEEGKGEVNGR